MYIPRYENYTLDVPLEYKNLLKEEVLSYKSTIRQIILQKIQKKVTKCKIIFGEFEYFQNKY